MQKMRIFFQRPWVSRSQKVKKVIFPWSFQEELEIFIQANETHCGLLASRSRKTMLTFCFNPQCSGIFIPFKITTQDLLPVNLSYKNENCLLITLLFSFFVVIGLKCLAYFLFFCFFHIPNSCIISKVSNFNSYPDYFIPFEDFKQTLSLKKKCTKFSIFDALPF